MTDSIPQCCGRAMTAIGVEQASSDLTLHSCPSCGRHAWRSGGRAVDRAELLAALTVSKAAPARCPTPPAAAPDLPVVDEETRRAELQRLLAGFTVHGTGH